MERESEARSAARIRRFRKMASRAVAPARRLLATCGNPDGGRLGYVASADGTALFRCVEGGALDGETVTAAAAGGAFTLALTAGAGSVISFGDNSRGQLGHSPGLASSSTPLEALVPEEVVAVAAGDWHALALGASGGVWAWGCNRSGQCGLGPDAVGTDQPVPRLVPGLAGSWWEGRGGGSGPPPPRIVALAAGAAHSAALAEDGSVFTWGAGGAGQGGHGGGVAGGGGQDPPIQPAPRRVRALDAHGPVAALAAGGDRCGVLLRSGGGGGWGIGGDALVWGAWGGVSGGERRTTAWTPAPVPSLHAATCLAVGRMHALAGRGGAGPALAWGDGGDHGALGVGTFAAPGGVTAVPAPVLTAPDGGLGLVVEAVDAASTSQLPPHHAHLHLAALAAGWQHSLGVSPSGDLFAWGWGGSPGGAFPLTPGLPTGGGQLGLGDDNDRPAAGRVERILRGGASGGGGPLGAWRAVGVGAGINHSVALIDEL